MIKKYLTCCIGLHIGITARNIGTHFGSLEMLYYCKRCGKQWVKFKNFKENEKWQH